jgi:beta-N-acetylhexosaminidase
VAPAELLGRIARSEVGSVILFRPNVVGAGGQADPVATGALVGALRAAAPPDLPLPVAVDQEGGPVQRLRAPFTEWPSMQAVAAAGDPRRSFAVGRALGEELALVGIGWNFAPVLDVNTNPGQSGDRVAGVRGRSGRGHLPRAGLLARAARGGGARLRQAFPWTRGHGAGFAPRSAHGGAPPGTPAHGRAGALRRRHPGRGRGADECPRDVSGGGIRTTRPRCRRR